MHKRSILRLTLPTRYAFGDNFHALDLRLSRSFVLRERWRLSLIGDVIDQFHVSRGFVLELMVVVILVDRVGIPVPRQDMNWAPLAAGQRVAGVRCGRVSLSSRKSGRRSRVITLRKR
jgi:hypothetical protein